MDNNDQSKVKRIGHLPLLAIWVLLTLFSSCSVRKSVQAQLGFPVTKQLNPSKTSLTGEQHCEHPAHATLLDQTKKTGFEPAIDFLPSSSTLYLSATEKVADQPFSTLYGWFHPGKVPFYILYKKMKLWV